MISGDVTEMRDMLMLCPGNTRGICIPGAKYVIPDLNAEKNFDASKFTLLFTICLTNQT